MSERLIFNGPDEENILLDSEAEIIQEVASTFLLRMDPDEYELYEAYMEYQERLEVRAEFKQAGLL